jgi:hypothetical protein
MGVGFRRQIQTVPTGSQKAIHCSETVFSGLGLSFGSHQDQIGL